MENASTLAPRFDRSWTESFPWLQGPLFAGLWISANPVFNPIHRLARRLVVQRELDALARWSQSESQPLRWEVRHSSLHAGEFRIFQSDIDLAAIYRRTPSPLQLDTLAAGFRARKRANPLLGEVEVYTESEWRVRNRMRDLPAVADLIQLLWDFRKMHWTESALARKPHAYHRLKMENALSSSWKKLGESARDRPARRKHLGVGFRARLSSIFDRLGMGTELVSGVGDFYCDYLGCTFVSEDRHRSSELLLSDGHLTLPVQLSLKLLALLPPAQALSVEIAEQVQKLRRLPAVRRARAFVLLNEYLVVKSRQRTHPATAVANEGWLRMLREELLACGPIDWRGLAE